MHPFPFLGRTLRTVQGFWLNNPFCQFRMSLLFPLLYDQISFYTASPKHVPLILGSDTAKLDSFDIASFAVNKLVSFARALDVSVHFSFPLGLSSFNKV